MTIKFLFANIWEFEKFNKCKIWKKFITIKIIVKKKIEKNFCIAWLNVHYRAVFFNAVEIPEEILVQHKLHCEKYLEIQYVILEICIPVTYILNLIYLKI